ncbi:unnamed protein product [Closterium sp. Naga37s-1]|nr:unnamed protein product [Closterium sp. Naga37s-1]
MAGSVDPPTDVSLDGTSLASDASQWKLVAPGVWDLTRSLDWTTTALGSALTGVRAEVSHADVNGNAVTASGSLAKIGALDTALAVLPSMAGGRFQAMFSGAVVGGAKIRIATSTYTKVGLEVHLAFIRGATLNTACALPLTCFTSCVLCCPPSAAPPLCNHSLPPLSAPPLCPSSLPRFPSPSLCPFSLPSVMQRHQADKSAPLALACPFASNIKGVFTCSKTVDVKIPAGSATTPGVLGLQKFMAALVGATMSGDNLAATFTLTVGGQEENLYYAL